MISGLNGATRIHVTIGDPIAQVKSPAGITEGFEIRGQDAIMIPLQVKPADVAGVGLSGQMHAIARQADGKYLVGGSFSLTSGGHTYYYFVRLAADGQLEPTFNVYDPNVGLPINSTVESIAVQPDQHIVIAGNFSAVQGQAERSLARLNPDGTLDTGFNIGNGANGTIQGIEDRQGGEMDLSRARPPSPAGTRTTQRKPSAQPQACSPEPWRPCPLR